jgi:hypothetical protein
LGTRAAWWPKPLKDLKAATFNARTETVADKPFFRDAFRRTRCLIPASGYYEWQDTATGKQPWYFSRTDGEPMTFAGLWDEWKDKATGEVLKSARCSLLSRTISLEKCMTVREEGSPLMGANVEQWRFLDAAARGDPTPGRCRMIVGG